MTKTFLRTLLIAASTALAFSVPGHAQTAAADGEVRKIDPDTGKITLKHGPIKNLDMDSMTMVFRVADPAMLKGLKTGDRVKFAADRVNGQITIINLERAK
jgi:Cu(I)/Ag(I) efflux system periplasmic protein CusF